MPSLLWNQSEELSILDVLAFGQPNRLSVDLVFCTILITAMENASKYCDPSFEFLYAVAMVKNVRSLQALCIGQIVFKSRDKCSIQDRSAKTAWTFSGGNVAAYVLLRKRFAVGG